MKEVKKVLSAALAATLATGALGTVAGAAPVDDLYKAAYDATINALNKKDQDSINAARVAIDKLPSELQVYKGEFSKQVDTVQHPILVTIVDSINNAEKTLKQVDINTARKAIPANLPEGWRNAYSSGVDAVQQKLIVKAVEASEKATKSQKRVDVDAARAMLAEIATVENNDGVKTWVATYEKDFMSNVKLSVDSIEVLGDKVVRLNFTKEVDANTVSTNSFRAYQTESKKSLFASAVKVSDDKKSVEVTFAETFVLDTKVTLEVTDIKDLNGKVKDAEKVDFTYSKSGLASIELTKTTFRPSEDITKYLVIKDSEGKDVTKTTTYEFQSTNGLVKADGTFDANKVAAKVTTDNVAVVVKKDGKADGKEIIKSQVYTVKVEAEKANTIQGVSLYKDADAAAVGSAKYDQITKVDSIKVGDNRVNNLAIFCTDQYGNAMTAVVGNKITVKENLTPSIAMLSADGKIDAKSAGTAKFKVKIAGIEDEVIVSVNVKAEAKVASVYAENSSVTVAANTAEHPSTVTKDVVVALRDQNGDDMMIVEKNDKKVALTADMFKVEVKNDKGNFEATTLAAVTQTAGKDEFKLTIKPDSKVGTKTFRVTYTDVVDDVDVDYSKEITVQYKEAGDFVSYKVDNEVKTLNLYDENKNDNINPAEGKFHVYSVDKNGNSISELKNAEATIEVVNKNNKVVANNTTGTAFTISYNAADGYVITAKTDAAKPDADKYTVNVKVGTLVVDTYTLSVVDTGRTAEKVTFDVLSVSATQFKKDDVASIVTVVDQFGKKVDFNIAGNTAVASEFVKTNEIDGEYQLVITKVTVKINDGNTKEIKLDNPQTVKVTK